MADDTALLTGLMIPLTSITLLNTIGVYYPSNVTSQIMESGLLVGPIILSFILGGLYYWRNKE